MDFQIENRGISRFHIRGGKGPVVGGWVYHVIVFIFLLLQLCNPSVYVCAACA